MSRFTLAAAVAVLAFSSMTFSGEVVVGTNAEFMPFEFMDEDNNIVGYDIDVVMAVAKAAGFPARMHHQSFDTLIEGLDTGRLDAVISGMTITDARKEKVDFSDPYYNAAQVIVVRDKTNDITKIGDIKDKKVGVQLGTTGAMMAEEAMGQDNPELKQFKKYNEVFSELSLGRIDAIVVDLPVAEAYVKKMRDLKISSEPMSEEQYGIAVKKGNKELLDKINDGLKKIRASGEFDEITSKWFQN